MAVKKMRDKDDFRANGLLAGSIAADFSWGIGLLKLAFAFLKSALLFP